MTLFEFDFTLKVISKIIISLSNQGNKLSHYRIKIRVNCHFNDAAFLKLKFKT